MTAKKTAQRQGFKTGEAIVYPAHGVGRITAIEEQEIAGFKLELFVVSFEKDKMVLRVPTAKAASVGMRKLAEPTLVQKGLDVLTGRELQGGEVRLAALLEQYPVAVLTRPDDAAVAASEE